MYPLLLYSRLFKLTHTLLPPVMAKNLLDLSNDIFVLILEKCDQRTHYNLVLASKLLHSICTPQLYRDIDLSSHHFGRIREWEDIIQFEMWANTDDSLGSEGLLSRQRSFLHAIIKHSEYASHVRSLSWTLLWCDRPYDDGIIEIDYQIWNVFAALKRVTRLDLAHLPVDFYPDPFTRQPPPVLFPMVTDLSLSGWMPHQLVTNILNSIDLSKLRSLNLDALQEEGNLPNGELMPEEVNRMFWNCEWRTRLCGRVTKETPLTDRSIIFPGPMWLPIVPLIGKLDSLRCLKLRIPPLHEEDCLEHMHFISVMATLVASVTPTILELDLDYAQSLRYLGTIGNHQFPRAWNIERVRLRQSMTILETFSHCFLTCNWESLQKISLSGFIQTCQIPYPSMDVTRHRTLQASFKNHFVARDVEFDWSDDSPRPARLFLGHDVPRTLSSQELEALRQVFGQIQ